MNFTSIYVPVHVNIFVWTEVFIAEIASFKEAEVVRDGILVWLSHCRFEENV